MRLHYSTVSPLLHETLKSLMSQTEFSKFRLVGGTALSLFLGHRMSVDIDLFTDEASGSVNFEKIDVFLRKTYPYFDTNSYTEVGMGKSYFIGSSEQHSIKLDLFYTDVFTYECVEIDAIRLASMEEIAAMKLDVIARTGRKKDFWDIDELKDHFSITEMLAFHLKRHPHTHDPKTLKLKMIDFVSADEDFTPICLKGKHWELVKLDMMDLANEIHLNEID
jgi:hypothetical protein